MSVTREVPTPTRGSGPVDCCGGHRKRCLFGRPHSWSTWYENGKLQRTPDTFHCHLCGGVCMADEDETLLECESALEGGGFAWMVRGPRGRLWQVRWEPGTPGQNIRAYRLADGHTGFLGSASTEEEARAEALRIAEDIKAGKTRSEEGEQDRG